MNPYEVYSETYLSGYMDGWESAIRVIRNIILRNTGITVEDLADRMEATPEEIVKISAKSFLDSKIEKN